VAEDTGMSLRYIRRLVAQGAALAKNLIIRSRALTDGGNNPKIAPQ